MDPKNAPKGAVRSEGAGTGTDSDADAAKALTAKADLEAAAAAKELEAEAAKAKLAEQEAAAAAEAAKPEYQVAPGKSITSLRGMLDAGSAVNLSDFYAAGDEKTKETAQRAALKRLVDGGHVVHNKKAETK